MSGPFPVGDNFPDNDRLNDPLGKYGRSGASMARKAPPGCLLAYGPAFSGAAMVASRALLAPVFVPAGTTISHVWFGLTTGAASSFFRPLIYDCDPVYLYPGALRLDVGQVDTSGGAADIETALASPLYFPADTLVYCGGVAQGGTPSVRVSQSISGVATYAPTYAAYSRSGLATSAPNFRKDGVTAAPPALWTPPAIDWTNLAFLNVNCPWVGLRVA